MKKGLMIFFMAVLQLFNCKQPSDTIPEAIDYRQKMRNFVIDIRIEADLNSSNFIIIPQNGQELITSDGEPGSAVQTSYITAVDGSGREDLFYGYDMDNETTPVNARDDMLALCDLFEQNGVEVLATDYCFTQAKMDYSFAQNLAKGYISFAAPERDLNVIPDYPVVPFNTNNEDITDLSAAKNFLYLINSEKFNSKQTFINAVKETDYDIIIIDLFFDDGPFTTAEIAQLKIKKGGGHRLAVAYMSIGEAEDYRYYWQDGWTNNPPEWLDAENPEWPGNYKVRFWMQDWQNLISGAADSYFRRILDAGFDGVYLDIIDAYEYYEE